MNIAVVGHVEWGRFARVSHMPITGEIIHASEAWEEVAGGGGVAAMQLAKLNGSCTFFTAVGDDELGKYVIKQLRENGVKVYASISDNKPTKTIMVHIDNQLERTITVTGNLTPNKDSLALPWDKLADMDAVYFVSGDASILQYARKAKMLVSTARVLPVLKQANLFIDVLLASENDKGESYHSGDLTTDPGLIITTRGINGGILSDGSTYEAESIPAEKIIDTYGCGDSFAAGITYGLGLSNDLHQALQVATHAGAMAAQRRGAFGN